MAIEYNCSRRFVISIVINLGKISEKCPNVCKISKYVHLNIGFFGCTHQFGCTDSQGCEIKGRLLDYCSHKTLRVMKRDQKVVWF